MGHHLGWDGAKLDFGILPSYSSIQYIAYLGTKSSLLDGADASRNHERPEYG